MIKPPIFINCELDTEKFTDLAEFQRIWDEVRGDRFAPSWKELGFQAFPTRFIPFMFLVDVQTGPLDFKYRFIGTAICKIEGIEYTGKSVDDIQYPELAVAARERFEALYNDPRPTFFMMQEQEVNRSKMRTRVYGGLRLPLSSDGVSMNQFVVLCHFEQTHPELRDYFDKKNS